MFSNINILIFYLELGDILLRLHETTEKIDLNELSFHLF